MPRAAVTKGDVERAVKGAVAAGMQLGTFEVRVARGEVRILPCERVQPQGDEPNPWDTVTPS